LKSIGERTSMHRYRQKQLEYWLSGCEIPRRVYNAWSTSEFVGMTKAGSSSTICSACGANASGKFCNACGTPLGANACRSCGATLPAGARFCNECGTSVAAGAAPRGAEAAAGAPTQDNAVAKYLPWGLAAVLLVAVSAYFINGASTAPAVADAGAAPFAPFANGGGGAAPDIANMSPRERASRLYDRIMRYTEQGKADSAQFFAPMALASFEMLGAELDTDARYDYGRVAAVTGNLVIAAAQADTILQAAPTHLLGLSLRARTATARGDAATAATAWKSFLASRDGELKKNLPEYQMHAADIEQSVALAAAK